MFEALNITEADAAGMAELAELDLAMAKEFAARARAAEDPDVANGYVRSYARVARSYRQSQLAKARLTRELQRIAADAPPVDPAKAPARVPHTPIHAAKIQERYDDIYEGVSRVVWTEVEDPADMESENDGAWPDYFDKLLAWLGERSLKPGYLDRPLDEHIVDTCRELGLDPELGAQWRELDEFPMEIMCPPQAASETPEPEPEKPRFPPNSTGAIWTYPAGWKKGDLVQCEPFDTREPKADTS